MPSQNTAAIIKYSLLTTLLAAAVNRCHAFESIEVVTKERAKELGMEIRASPAGPDAVRVELAFESKGELKGYSRVALEIHDEGKLHLSATLREEPSKPGHIVVSFAADRTRFSGLTLKVVTLSGGERVGRVLQIRDFVDLAKVR